MLPLLILVVLPHFCTCAVLGGNVFLRNRASCGLNEEYRKCGPKCPPTCDTLQDTICCAVACVAGCFCVDGYMLESKGSSKCIPVEECPSPGMLRFEKATYVFPESGKLARILVLRVNGSHKQVTVRWRVTGISPYQGKDGLLVFPDGVLSQYIEIPIVDNDYRNPDITFRLELYEPSLKAQIVSRFDKTDVTITDDDMKPGYPEIENLSLNVMEKVGVAKINVVRIGGTDGQIRVKYKTVVDTAKDYSDFTPVLDELIFEEGETMKTIIINIIDDKIREQTESFAVTIYDPTAASDVRNFRPLGTKMSATITIQDDDMTPGFLELVARNYNVPESIGTVKIEVNRSEGTDGEIRVKYKTVPRTAQSEVDFRPVFGELVFEEGETKKYILIPITDDGMREPTEDFEVVLYDPTAASDVINFRGLGTRLTTTITIADDDMKPGYLELGKGSYTVSESAGSVTIEVNRVGGSDGEIQVQYKTVQKTALPVLDFKTVTGEVTFKDGETTKYIIVQIINDDIREPNEIFEISLYEPTAAPDVINFNGLGSRITTEITIIDDDMKPGYLEYGKSTYTVSENVGVVKVEINRIDGSEGKIRAWYKTVPKTALPVLDFKPVTGELVFQEGETKKYVSIPVIDDVVREPSENFEVILYDSSAGPEVINFRGLGSITKTTITITDDDMRPGYLELSKQTYVVSENVGTLKIAVNRIDGSDGEIRVWYKTVSKTAVSGLDFQPVTGELVFREGEIIKYILIEVRDDNVREPTKIFEVQLYDISAGEDVINFRGFGQKITAVISITDDDMTPGYIEIDEASYEIFEDIGTLRIRVVRRQGSDGQIQVRFETVSRTALVRSDFTPASGVLVFEEGETEKFIVIPIVDDDVREPTETFEVRIFEPSAGPGVINFRGLGSKMTVVVTIKDNDMTPGYLEFEEASYEVYENVGSLRIRVVRLGGTDGQIQVRYEAVPKTAQIRSDFTPTSGIFIFEEGETEKFIVIPIVDDDMRELTEVFQVRIFDSTPGPGVINFRGLGNKVVVDVTIKDNDMKPGYLEYEKPSYVISESAGSVRVRVVRVDGNDGEVLVYYKTVSKTARDGVDFQPISGQLVFKEGETRKDIIIPITDDTILEPTEMFEVELYDSKAAPGVINFRGLGARRRITVTITDDDMRPGYLIMGKPTYVVLENTGTLEIEVNRLDGSDGEIRVKYKTVGRTALSMIDFNPASGELVFQDGERQKFISIQIVNDKIKEPSESFEIQLYAATSGPGVINFRGLGSRTKSTVIINDDDINAGILEMEKINIAVPEDVGSAQVTILRTNGADGKLVARYVTVDGTARAGMDYTIIEGDIIFQEGEIRHTITIPIIDDSEKEPMENFQIQLFTKENPSDKKITTVTIIDNDETPGTFQFRESSLSIREGDLKAILTVQRTEGTDGSVSLKWRTMDGTAREGLDYKSRQGTVTFNEGEREKTFAIDIIDDKIKENDENFIVGLFDPTRGMLGRNSMVTVSIKDDDDVPDNIEIFFTSSTVSVKKDANAVRFKVRRTGDLRPMSFYLETLDGTAKANQHYKRTRGEVQFGSNEIELTIEVKLISNTFTGFSFFIVKISKPSEGIVVPGRDLLTVLIGEDEGNLDFKSLSARKGEFVVSEDKSGTGQTSGESSSSTETRRVNSTFTYGTGGSRIDTQGSSNSFTGTSGVRQGSIDIQRTNGGFAGTSGAEHTYTEIRRTYKVTGTGGGGVLDKQRTSTFTGMSGIRDGSVGSQLPDGARHTYTEIRRTGFTGTSGTGGGPIETRRIDSTITGTSGVKESTLTSGSKTISTSEFTARGSEIDELKTKKCPTGMTFRICAPTCPQTCATMIDKGHSCGKKCINACFCPDGQVIENLRTLRCIQPSQCQSQAELANRGDTRSGELPGLRGLGGLGGLLSGVGALG